MKTMKGKHFLPRGWLVCLSSFYAKGAVAGLTNTFGILYVALLAKYASGDPNISTNTAFIGSLAPGMLLFLSHVGNVLCDGVGIRKVSITGAVIGGCGLIGCAFVNQLEMMYLSYGVLVGIGSAFNYCPSTIILGHYFSRNLGIANGITEFGSSVFSVTYSLVLPLTLERFDIKYTLIGEGVLFLSIELFSLSWKPLIPKKTRIHHISETDFKQTSGHKLLRFRIIDTSLFKNRDYMMLCFYMTLTMFGYASTLAHSTVVFPEERSALLVTFLQVASGISRLMFGKISDSACNNIMHLHRLTIIVMGITIVSIPFSTSFSLLMAQSIVFGICDGICVLAISPIVMKLLGIIKAGQGIGFIYFCICVPFTVGPIIAASVYDSLKSYDISFYVLGVTTFAGPFAVSVFYFVSYQLLKSNKPKSASN